MKKIYIKGLEVVQKEELETEYLSRTNVEEYTPINDYNPATKKYVDDIIQEIADALAEINNGGDSGE